MLLSTELTHPFPDPPASPYLNRLGSSSLTPAVQGQLWTGLKVTKTLRGGLDPFSKGSEQPGGRTEGGMGRSWTSVLNLLGKYREESWVPRSDCTGTGRHIKTDLGEMHASACDASCSILTMLLALGWTKIHGHCVLGNFWLRIYLRIYPGGTVGTDCAKTVCSVSLTTRSYCRTAFVLGLPLPEGYGT